MSSIRVQDEAESPRQPAFLPVQVQASNTVVIADVLETYPAMSGIQGCQPHPSLRFLPVAMKDVDRVEYVYGRRHHDRLSGMLVNTSDSVKAIPLFDGIPPADNAIRSRGSGDHPIMFLAVKDSPSTGVIVISPGEPIPFEILCDEPESDEVIVVRLRQNPE